MRAMRRCMKQLVKDESGMTLILALIMIVLIGVMGAGLLTFVSRDLNAVFEVNQGQRAFEAADAGVQAAKQQLTADCVGNTTCMDHYDDDGNTVLGTEDIQWSGANGGMTLNNLDGSAGTSDSVNVTIDYRYATNDFLILSTGTYGDAKRKVEAIFKGASGSGGGSGIGLPTYFTPSAIRVEDPLTLNGVSLFSENDILINNSSGLTTPAKLITDYEDNGGYLKIPGVQDELKDWDSTKFTAPNTGTWNTVGRKGGASGYKTCAGTSKSCTTAGLAALGKICGSPVSAATCGSNPSVADGVYGYDSTTGTKGNNLTFVNKNPPTSTNASGTITFPFPRPTPNPERLRGYAKEVPGNHYYEGSSPPWDTLFPNGATSSQVVFIDAKGGTLDFSTSNSANNKGILVVWCGNLRLNAKFQGIVLNLWPQVSNQLPGGSTCDNSKGIVTNNGQDFSGWLYAQGGNSTTPGIQLKKSTDGKTNPSMNSLPSGSWSFFNDAFTGAPPTSFELQSWRELYE